MKITVIGTRGFPGVQGGVEKHCEKLYTRLAKKGCDITVFTREPYVDFNVRVYEGVSLDPLRCPKSKYFEAFVHTFKSVLKARKYHPDILHIHAIGPSLFAPVARFLGMKVVITHHGPDYKRKKWPLPAKLFLKISESIGVKFANEVIAIADNISNDLKKKYDINAAVIPNGVEIPKIASTEDVLKKMKLHKGEYILAVGRLVPEKGFDVLIDAFKEGRLESWKLVIVGRADHEDEFSRNLKIKAGKNKDIILTGFLTGQPLHELYSHAGLFVLPSYYEGLPITLLEAMSYGLSCLASDIPANRNVKLSEERFFRVGDVESLNSKIKEFINKSWEEKERKKQIDMIAEKYNWEKIADDTLKCYRKVMANIHK